MDHDFMIDREDLLRYGSHALTYRIVDRIFSGAPRPLACRVAGKMGCVQVKGAAHSPLARA